MDGRKVLSQELFLIARTIMWKSFIRNVSTHTLRTGLQHIKPKASRKLFRLKEGTNPYIMTP